MEKPSAAELPFVGELDRDPGPDPPSDPACAPEASGSAEKEDEEGGEDRPLPRRLSVDSSGGVQLASKLTIGRPGLSLTAVGVGILRSLLRQMRVALRTSSDRISTPFLRGTSLASAAFFADLDAEAVESDRMYMGFLDCVGGLR